jgi:short-subunit dehydrogenase
VTFAQKYGPWALVAGASEGVGAAFAEAIAERGVNVVLLARRAAVLDEVASRLRRHGVETRVVATDLAADDAVPTIIEATRDLEIGMVVYCAGADPDFRPFLSQPIEIAETMLRRNCLAPMRLCHHFAPAMVSRGRGGIVLFGSGAGFAGGPNMVAYSATKAFDMVFAEALWTELHDSGVDVLGLILGKTDTPALRPASVDDVIAEAFDNLANGPTWIVGENLRAAAQMMGSVSRSDAVRFIMQASAASMGAARTAGTATTATAKPSGVGGAWPSRCATAGT